MTVVAPFAQPEAEVVLFAWPGAETVSFAQPEAETVSFAQPQAEAVSFAQPEAKAGSARPVFRLFEAAAGRWTPAKIVPRVYRQAGSVFLVVRVVSLLVAAPQTTKSRQELAFQRDFLWWVLPEDFASGSKSLSSQLKEATKAQEVQRPRLLPLPSQHPATKPAF